MNRLCFAAVFLLLFVFDVQNVSARNIPGFIGTELENGCHDFYGKIECQNGQQILPSAKVSVMEYDDISINDIISTAKLYEQGYYKIVGCVENNGIGSNGELFLEFEDACFDGQRFQVPNPKPDTFESHLIGNEEDNIGNGAEISNDDKNQVPDSNHPIPRFQNLRSQYPPMPRPYNRRRRHVHQIDLMNADKQRGKRSRDCSTLKVESGTFVSFKGIVKCYDEKTGQYKVPQLNAVVKLIEHDIFGNDVLAKSMLKSNGEYEIKGKAVDFYEPFGFEAIFAEISVQFENVCFDGDVYENSCPNYESNEDMLFVNGWYHHFVNPKDNPDFYAFVKS